ncbi:MAG TPA: PLP-dependent aminotransferase family protein [Clostridia bacterium]|nr:PLP-dependent aminotransferase family protein [Clostridia bacterium]
MFTDINLSKERPAYLQIKEYIKHMISKGMLQEGQKLPSTRELSVILHVSRNTVIEAYNCLKDEGFIDIVNGKGTFVMFKAVNCMEACNIKWQKRISSEARLADQLDIMKHGITYKKGMISFTSIAPDEKYFDLDNLKRAFLDRIPLEGKKILNYGYAKGYRPLMRYLLKYMESKGLDTDGKDILVTNGFTEGFDLVLSALCDKGQKVVCENPTHNTAIKIFKLHGLDTIGVRLDSDGMNLDELSKALSENDVRLAYLIPSYHNPTGIVMPPEKRAEILTVFGKYNLPVIEDGFNEELRYSGSHVAPLIACNGKGNNVIYIGSFSKILFPGLRVGWVIGDKSLISYMESLKRSRNIHTSAFDQALLYQYLNEGNFERYIKKVRKIYKEKYQLAISCTKESIPCKNISGEGGLHIFIELDRNIDSRIVLEQCYKKGVVFTPGDIFYTDNTGKNTLRIGFSRVENEDIIKGIKIIGEVIRKLLVQGVYSQ